MHKQEEKNLYLLGWILLGIFLSYLLIAKFSHFRTFFHLPCLFRTLTGYYCPGCGGTRAVQALVHVELLRSLRCHPAVLPGVVMSIVFWIGMTCEKIVRPNIKRFKLRRIYFYVVLGIVMIQWIVKNVLLYALGWHI